MRREHNGAGDVLCERFLEDTTVDDFHCEEPAH
jgi:hypothetical protein